MVYLLGSLHASLNRFLARFKNLCLKLSILVSRFAVLFPTNCFVVLEIELFLGKPSNITGFLNCLALQSGPLKTH